MGVNRHDRRSLSFGEWKDVLVCTLNGIGNSHATLYAAGVAFYMLFSLFPALGAATWLLGLMIDPEIIRGMTVYLHDILPDQALVLVQQQLISLTEEPGTGISIVGITNAAIALFTARTAAASMIEALNTIYAVEETRSILKLNAVAIMFTAVAIVAMIAAIGFVLVVPTVLALLHPDDAVGRLLRLLRWPVLGGLTILALAVIYHYGPNRQNVQHRWFTWGSVIATVIWLAASVGFSWYVEEFNSYNRVYGSLGAVVILLFWFWLTAFMGLAGAQFDKQLEAFRRR